MEINNCFHCGTEAQSTWRFCRRCGTTLESVAEIPKIAQCSNCSAGLGDGWRFCLNCGTSADTATASTQHGLTPDDVADLIAAPGAAAPGSTPAPSPEPAPAPPAPTAATAEPAPAREAPLTTDRPEVVDEAPALLDPADAPTPPIEVAQPVDSVPGGPTPAEPAPGGRTPGDLTPGEAARTREVGELGPGAEPPLEVPKVTFEPSGETGPSARTVMPPAPDAELITAPPAPPPDPSLPTVPEIVANRMVSDPPPAAAARSEAAEATAERVQIAEPDSTPKIDADRSVVPEKDPFAVGDRPTGTDEPAVPAASVVEAAPAVVIPPAPGETSTVRREMPRPIGAPVEQTTKSIPRPIGADPDPGREEAPAVRSLSSMAARVERPPARPPSEELPPIDGRSFSNPGLFGQGVQLVLLATASLGVAMIVALTVLNNRLDDYAKTGESLVRIESAESIINNWLRPLLALAILAAYILIVLWVLRAVRNLSVFDKFVPEAALWMWAIPLANIVVLRQHLDFAWKGSDILLKGDDQWRKSRGNWWTLAFTVLAFGAFAVIIYAAFFSAESIERPFESAIDANAISMIGYGMLVASLLCLVRAVGDVIERQRTRVQEFD